MKREFISLSGLKKVLSPKEMKNITGGCEDPIDLDEFVITCDQDPGQCWECRTDLGHQCSKFTGKMSDYCDWPWHC